MQYIFALFAILALAGCSSSSMNNASQKEEAEPQMENPYDEGTGHDAGYKWAERTGGDCNGNSASFNEGCEEYHAQQDAQEQGQ